MRKLIQTSTPDNHDPHSPSRRKLLRAGALLIALVTTNIPVVFSREEAASQLAQNLQKLAWRLFPHDQLPATHYRQIANSLLSRAATDTQLADFLLAGVARLDEGCLTPWLLRDEAQQLAAIKRLEGSEFFRLLRSTTIEHLYRNEEVWRLLGYQGSSIEFGGYVDRGFDDIDWLPVESKPQ